MARELSTFEGIFVGSLLNYTNNSLIYEKGDFMRILICFLLLSFQTFGSQTAQAASLKETKTTGVLRMATEGAFVPFNYYQGGELTGFEVELGNELAKKMNYHVELVLPSMFETRKQVKGDCITFCLTTR